MKTWHAIRNRWYRWFQSPADQNQQCEAALLCEELQALLDLCCYAASQALAFSKWLDYQIKGVSDTEVPIPSDIVPEYIAVKTEVDQYRETIALLHKLLHAARQQLALAPVRFERESTHRMVAELLAGRELEDLKQTIKSLGHNFAGSDP